MCWRVTPCGGGSGKRRGGCAIEPESELVQVGLKVFRSQTVVDAERPGLQVGEDAVDPWQHDMSGHRTDDMGIVGDIRCAGIARPAVGADRGAGSDVGGDEAVQRCRGEVGDLGEANAAGPAVCDFDRPGNEHFALVAATATPGDRIIFAAQANFRLVDLGETGQRRAARRDRRPAKLGAQQPRRLVGAEAELVAELPCRNAVGMGGHEPGRPEPGGQRQLRTVHDGACGDRGLLAAGGALEGERLSAMPPSLRMVTRRTAEARRPAHGEQPSRAGGFIREASLKVDERGGNVGHGGASGAAAFALRSYQPATSLSLHLAACRTRVSGVDGPA